MSKRGNLDPPPGAREEARVMIAIAITITTQDQKVSRISNRRN